MTPITQTREPVHPNRILQRELDARELNVAQAAAEVGVSTASFQAVMDGGPFTSELAEALERTWGTSAALWLRMQTMFETHPGQHGGRREGAGRPPSGNVTAQVRVTGSAEEIEQIKAWIAAQGQGNGAQATASALLKGIQARSA